MLCRGVRWRTLPSVPRHHRFTRSAGLWLFHAEAAHFPRSAELGTGTGRTDPESPARRTGGSTCRPPKHRRESDRSASTCNPTSTLLLSPPITPRSHARCHFITRHERFRANSKDTFIRPLLSLFYSQQWTS
ncbi:hypothetical protein SKAU_G00221430 [Synaphobranchus kaupii]|uniref:Uncharacterized protein n=1 Tax=Synaphobranchus kaupii TaxID=118154 RepID=A0A9Q1FBB9_SYNKA|nr:hypothetical protein SKAU_G00221430 [Synaphobranchus kaupii]